MEVAGGAIMELRFRAVDEAGTASVVYAYVFNITAAPPIPVVEAFVCLERFGRARVCPARGAALLFCFLFFLFCFFCEHTPKPSLPF